MDHIDIRIPLSRGKVALSILGTIAMVAASVFIWYMGVLRVNWVLKVIAVLGGSLFGILLIFWIKKLVDPKPGLVLNKQGIWDNSNSISVGLIPWHTIIGIGELDVFSQKMILVNISNPKEIIGQQGLVKRRLLESNYKRYGTPIAIISNTLDCSYAKLYELMIMELGKYGQVREG